MGSVSALFILKTLRLTFHILLPLELQLLTLGLISDRELSDRFLIVRLENSKVYI